MTTPRPTQLNSVTLTSDEVDDLIYLSRTGDLSGLQEMVQTLSQSYQCSLASTICSALDVDEDGLGSGCCLLHYPAANGSLDTVHYLLSVVNTVTHDPTTQEIGVQQTEPTGAALRFVNHQNVSGNTSLHWAGMNGHLEIVKALLKVGADPELVNSAGRDAVVESEWSSKTGAADCAVWMLKECGALEKGIGEEGQASNAQDEESARNDEQSHQGLDTDGGA